MKKLKSIFVAALLLASSLVINAQTTANTQPAGPQSLKGKNLFTLFDSLGQTGVWQERLAELSGMNFDQYGNFNYFRPISYGGACTGLYGPVCGMQRARNLVEVGKTKSVDYIMMENTNDFGQFATNPGTIDDAPWFWSYTSFVPDCGLASADAAANWWNTHFSEIIGSMAPETGAVVRIPFANKAVSCEAKVLSGTVADGIINLHNREFLISIPVKAGMSPEQLTDYLMTVAVRPGTDCIRRSATEICYIDYIKGVNTVSFDCGGTGAVISTCDGTGLSTYDRFFVGKDVADWADPDCWTAAPSIFSQWKGFTEYVISHFPTARIYWFIPTYYMCSPENAKLKFSYFDAQKKLAAYYGIPVLDIYAESGINESNILDFYEQGNVHPKDSGYIRWGETAYRLLLQ